MKHLSEKITSYMVKSGEIAKESYVIYQYGVQIGLEMLSCFLTCLGVALFMHMVPEFFIFTGIFISLRTYVGGMHFNSFFKCLLFSVLVQISVLEISSQLTLELPISWGLIISSSLLLVKNCPVESINRELDIYEKKHCKKITIKVLAIVFFLVFVWTFRGMKKNISLSALTIVIVLIFQYIGKLKYQIEKQRWQN